MCMCSPEFSSIFGVDEKSKQAFKERLPKLIEEWVQIQSKQERDRLNWQVQSAVKKADIIFYNGTIYTMDQNKTKVEALSIIKDRIISVGSQQVIFQRKGPNTKVIDLKGRTLLPGFIDPHIHMAFSSIKNWTQLSPFVHNNMDQVYQTIVFKVNAAKQHQWVLFQLFDPMITTGVIDVSKKSLDKLSTQKAIFILQANGHVAHVNSYAFQKLNITKDSEDPPHGRFMKDYNRQLTGELQQTAIGYFTSRIEKVSGQQYINNFQKFISHASSKGCTSLHDCGIGLVGADTDLCVLLQVFKQEAPIRYSGYIISTLWDQWMKRNMKPNFKDDILRINGVKCWVDGSTQAGSALLRDPYLNAQWGNGFANYSQNKINSAVLQAHKKGFQVGIHANGDAGIQMALKAFQNAQKCEKKFNLRHRIQHSTVCPRQLLKKMKQLGVSPSFLIGHVYYYGAAFKDRILGQERANTIDPMKSALQQGLIPTIHCDYNCQPIDPLRCIYNAVTRIMKQGKGVLNQKQCVTPYQAVKAMTISAAWQCHMQDIVGSLEKGKFADFVILEEDPMKVAHQQIINIKISQTWKGGQKWYQG